MTNSFLAGIRGDSIKPNHRAALIGNAMVFNANRWVRVTAGTDPLPQLMPQNVFTVITSLIVNQYVNFNGFLVGAINAGFYSTTPIASYKNGFRCFPNWAFGVFDNSGSFTGETFVNISTGEPLNKKIISIIAYNGTIPVEIDRFDFFLQGRKRLDKNLFYSGAGSGALPQEPIGIGRLHNFQAYFVGQIRSVEILLRTINNQEARKVFNLGTAHAAGLITAQDISIDFNRINGQAPICRTGSRQLTVTPMNNNTPDTAGTIYTPFL